MFNFPFIDHFLQFASDLDGIISVNATMKKIGAVANIDLVFF